MIEARGKPITEGQVNEEDGLKEEITTEKLSPDRYISFLDNVMIPYNGFTKGRTDSSL
jgi:hypothetical protein